MSQYGIVNTITASPLKDVTQPHLIAFEIDYSAYVERVPNVNQSRPQNQQIKVASIRQCIQPKRLQSMCTFGRINGAKTAEKPPTTT